MLVRRAWDEWLGRRSGNPTTLTIPITSDILIASLLQPNPFASTCSSSLDHPPLPRNMKVFQILTFFTLGALPALALAEPSKILTERRTTFTCAAGKRAQCCDVFLAGVGTQPTGIGLGCSPRPEGGACGADESGACCMIQVSGSIMI